jgi:negative regulator of flagellin synthesis FlgM
MTIEINGQAGNKHVQNQPTGVQLNKDTGKPTGNDDKATTTHSRGADTVSLTDTAERLQSIEAKLQNTPVVDKHKVDSIRQALNEGSYQIDANKIADKLLAFESSLYK